MAADNRKTFRLEDKAQEILTTTKDRRGCTENDAVNYIISQHVDQGKKIVELHDKTVELNNSIYLQSQKIKELEKERQELKAAFRLIGSLFDSKPAADQPGAGAGQAQN